MNRVNRSMVGKSQSGTVGWKEDDYTKRDGTLTFLDQLISSCLGTLGLDATGGHDWIGSWPYVLVQEKLHRVQNGSSAPKISKKKNCLFLS